MVDISECCVFFFLFVLAAAFVKEIAFFVQTEIKSHLGGRADEGWGMGSYKHCARTVLLQLM